jgi:hypothetical protein
MCVLAGMTKGSCVLEGMTEGLGRDVARHGEVGAR